MRGLVAALIAATATAAVSAQEPANPAPRYFNVPYVATPPEVVHAMLKLAKVTPRDVVYDLGSGDGRIVIAAARDFGVNRAVGLDNKQALVGQAMRNAAEAEVLDRVQFRTADFFTADFSEATVVTLYLDEAVNKLLKPRLLAMKPGTRIVSHQFRMGPEWPPNRSEKIGDRTIYLWIVPGRKR